VTDGAGTGRRRVLVVDDDDAIRRVVRAVLEADGFEVAEAADGRQALDRLAASSDGNGAAPRVVVLDVMMPELDGVEVCRAVDHDATRVLMLTARTDEATEAESMAAGADRFLTKPFSAIELLDAVESLL
jgi:two-component system response regulator MprA